MTLIKNTLLYILMLLFIPEGYSIQEQPYRLQGNEDDQSISNQSYKRNLSFDNCSYYDIFSKQCINCRDQFLLPDCVSCPVGYNVVNNDCVQCGQNQLFCGSSNGKEYCQIGFKKVGSSCICESGKQIIGDWCTTNDELIYRASYSKGKVIIELSQEIYLISNNNIEQFTSKTKNCEDLIENFDKTYSSYQDIQCWIDQSNTKKIYINLYNTDLQSALYEIVPTLNKDKIILKSSLTEPIQILYQPSQLTNAKKKQHPKIEINNFMSTSCGFDNRIRYIPSNGQEYTINLNEFTRDENYFSNSGPIFSLFYSQGLTKQEENDILKSFQAFPQDSIKISDKFQDNGYFKIVLFFTCHYPFNMVSSNYIKLQYAGDLSFTVKVALANKTPLYDDDSIQISITNQFHSFQNYDDDDQFSLYICYSDCNKEKSFSYLKNVPASDSPQKITIKSDSLQCGTYNLQVKSIYQTNSATSDPIELKILSRMNVEIIGGDIKKFDPKQKLQLVGLISDSSAQGQNKNNFSYSWSCYDVINDKYCIDQQYNLIKFQQQDTLNLDSFTFDYDGTYIFSLIGKNLSNGKSQKSSININTIASSINVIYDHIYDKQEVNIYQLLAFEIKQYSKLNTKTINISYSYEIGIQNQLISGQMSQKENYIYTKISEKVPENILQKQFSFNLRFIVEDKTSNNKEFSKRVYLKSFTPPSGCEINFDPKLTGNEISFVDQFQIKASSCKQSIKNSKLYYQFFYYVDNGESTGQQKIILSKLTESNQIKTYLPTGKIFLIVKVQDQSGGRIELKSTIVVKQNNFDQKQYETFLGNLNDQAIKYQNSNQYEEQLYTINMMIECIKDFQNINKQISDTQFIKNIKDQLKVQLMSLPYKISNDSTSKQLQEFNMSCLQRLFNLMTTKDSNSNMQKLDDISNLVKLNKNSLKNQLTPAQLHSYRNQLLMLLDMMIEAMYELSLTQAPSLSFSNRQIAEVSQISELIAQTLQTNQQSLFKETKLLDILIQKVDQINLIQNYYEYDESKIESTQLDESKIFNVEIQYWKKNIYSFEESFKQQTEPYLIKAKSQQIQQYLQQSYPAINPKITSSQWNRLLEQDQKDLNNANVQVSFEKIQGSNDKLKCIQRVDTAWTVSQCKTEVKQVDGSYTVVCTCSSPNFTSIVADVEALFTKDNFNNIFSESGFQSFLALDNWYEYSVFYVIAFINIAMIVTYVVGVRLDKADESGVGEFTKATNSLTNIIAGQQQGRLKSRQASVLSAFQGRMLGDIYRRQYTQNTPSHFKNFEIDQTPMSCKDDRQSQLDFQTKINQLENKAEKDQICPIRESIEIVELQTNTNIHKRSDTTTGLKNNSIIIIQNPLNSPVSLQQITQEKSSENQQYPDEENQTDDVSNTQQITQEKSQESQQYPDEENQTDHVSNQNQNGDVSNQYRRFFFESENHVQHCHKIEEEPKQKQSSHSILENNPKITRRQSIKEMKKLQRQESIRIKKERDDNVQIRSFAYLQTVPTYKGIFMFHDFFQIFITYNKKKSRFYRISIFYNQLIWLLTLTSIFGNTLSIVQVIALSLVSSVVFGLLRVVLKYILSKKKVRTIGYILTFSFLLFCYYSIFATVGRQSSSESNGWVINYGISQTIDIFITGGIFSVVKYYCTLVLLPKISIQNVIYKFMNAEAIFGIFK